MTPTYTQARYGICSAFCRHNSNNIKQARSDMDTDLTTPLVHGASKADHNIEVVEAVVLHVSERDSPDKEEPRTEEEEEEEEELDTPLNASINVVKFWMKCIARPFALILMNIFVIVTISHLAKKNHDNNYDNMFFNSTQSYQSKQDKILDFRARDVGRCYVAFAFLLFIDAVILLKFAIHIERMVENYWKDLGSEAMKKSVDLHSEEEGAEEEQHVLPTIGSRISLDYVYVFVSHQMESFLLKDIGVKKEKVKKSTFVSIIYLLATLCMLFSVFTLLIYGIMRGTSTGRFCFIKTSIYETSYRNSHSHQRPSRYECGSNNLTMSLSQKEYSKLPSTVRSWINETNPQCDDNDGDRRKTMEFEQRSTFVNMIDGDVFFLGSGSSSSSQHLVVSKKDDRKPFSFPNVVSFYSHFILDEDENDHLNVKRFCLIFLDDKYSRYSRYSYRRILCHPSVIDVPAGTFRNISLSGPFSQCRENLEGDLLILICFGSRYFNNYGYMSDNNRDFDVRDKYPPRLVLGYNASTMEEVFSHRIELHSNQLPSSKDTECDLKLLLIFSVTGSAFLVLSGLTLFKVKQSPAGALLLCAGPGFVLAYLPILFLLYYAVPASLLVSSLLIGKPTRPDWLSREVSWWLVYFTIILFWVLTLCSCDGDVDFVDKNRVPMDDIFETGFPILIALFIVATLVSAPLLIGIELPRPAWLTKELSIRLMRSIATLICLWSVLFICDNWLIPTVVVMCICSSITLLILNFMLGHPIFRILYSCTVFVISILVPVNAVLGDLDDVLSCLGLLLFALGVGAAGSRLEKYRPLLVFLCKQMFNKMMSWKKKK